MPRSLADFWADHPMQGPDNEFTAAHKAFRASEAPSAETPGQLPMFMSAREITSKFQPSLLERESAEGESHEQIVARKNAETKAGWGGPGFMKSVLEEGVRVPVHLSHQFGAEGKGEIGEGHHRIYLEAQHHPDRLMPVVHHANMAELGEHFQVSDYGVWDEERDWG